MELTIQQYNIIRARYLFNQPCILIAKFQGVSVSTIYNVLQKYKDAGSPALHDISIVSRDIMKTYSIKLPETLYNKAIEKIAISFSKYVRQLIRKNLEEKRQVYNEKTN